jgi:hypothetical protein
MKTLLLSCLLAFGLVATPVVTADAQERARSRPLNVPVYKKKYRGGYSYRKADAIDTRKFNDQTLSQQSQGGPFDSGYFFETPRGPYGGTSPYFH